MFDFWATRVRLPPPPMEGYKLLLTREELFDNTLSYLKRIEGITGLETDFDSNYVKIYYEPDPNSRSRIDYKKLSLFAGVKLSNKLKDEKIRFLLIKNSRIAIWPRF